MRYSFNIIEISLRLSALLIVVAMLASCDSTRKDSGSLDSVTRELDKTLEQARDMIEKLGDGTAEVPEMAENEVAKLFTFEYTVESLEGDLPASEIEARLAELGKERWECFFMERVNSKLIAYCKRRPRTYLRYIPRFF